MLNNATILFVGDLSKKDELQEIFAQKASSHGICVGLPLDKTGTLTVNRGLRAIKGRPNSVDGGLRASVDSHGRQAMSIGATVWESANQRIAIKHAMPVNDVVCEDYQQDFLDDVDEIPHVNPTVEDSAEMCQSVDDGVEIYQIVDDGVEIYQSEDEYDSEEYGYVEDEQAENEEEKQQNKDEDGWDKEQDECQKSKGFSEEDEDRWNAKQDDECQNSKCSHEEEKDEDGWDAEQDDEYQKSKGGSNEEEEDESEDEDENYISIVRQSDVYSHVLNTNESLNSSQGNINSDTLKTSERLDDVIFDMKMLALDSDPIVEAARGIVKGVLESVWKHVLDEEKVQRDITENTPKRSERERTVSSGSISSLNADCPEFVPMCVPTSNIADVTPLVLNVHSTEFVPGPSPGKPEIVHSTESVPFASPRALDVNSTEFVPGASPGKPEIVYSTESVLSASPRALDMNSTESVPFASPRALDVHSTEFVPGASPGKPEIVHSTESEPCASPRALDVNSTEFVLGASPGKSEIVHSTESEPCASPRALDVYSTEFVPGASPGKPEIVHSTESEPCASPRALDVHSTEFVPGASPGKPEIVHSTESVLGASHCVLENDIKPSITDTPIASSYDPLTNYIPYSDGCGVPTNNVSQSNSDPSLLSEASSYISPIRSCQSTIYSSLRAPFSQVQSRFQAPQNITAISLNRMTHTASSTFSIQKPTAQFGFGFRIPTFKPRSIPPLLSIPLISKKQSVESQTDNSCVKDACTSTRHVKTANICIETESCDPCDVCINTEQSMFTQDSDFYHEIMETCEKAVMTENMGKSKKVQVGAGMRVVHAESQTHIEVVNTIDSLLYDEAVARAVQAEVGWLALT